MSTVSAIFCVCLSFILGVGLMAIICSGTEDENEPKMPKDFNFPKGAKDIEILGNNYYEYTYKKRRILVYKPGTREMSMTNVSNHV